MFCLNSLPHIKRRYLTYGPRSTWVNATARSGAAEKDSQGCLVSGTVLQLQRILGVVETIQVPHGWFTHFYVFSVMSSLYWGAQIVSKGNVLQSLCLRTKQPKSMSMERIILTWSLMAIQGVRRLAESILVNKRSRSRMWFAHWLLGICFYIAMGLAIWIEGSGTFMYDGIAHLFTDDWHLQELFWHLNRCSRALSPPHLPFEPSFASLFSCWLPVSSTIAMFTLQLCPSTRNQYIQSFRRLSAPTTLLSACYIFHWLSWQHRKELG